jgi:hypothetical protein
MRGTALVKEDERRRWPRVALAASAVIRIESLATAESSRILNASQRGLLMIMPAPRPLGTRMHIRVQIGEPRYEIEVSGIVVHVADDPDAPPGFTTRVGVYLTDASPDWTALCRRLAKST